MSIGSGLAASLGFVPEVTFGTYVAPSRWLEITSADIKKTRATKQGGGMAAGRTMQLASRRVITQLGGEGSFEMELQNKQLGLLLAHLLGGTPTVVQQGATAAWLQTHTIGDNIGKFLTMQMGVPDTTGTVRPYTFLGTKIMGAEFKCDVGDSLATVKFDIDARDVSEAQSLVAPSYLTGLKPFNGMQLAVKIGSTYGAEATATGVTGVSCSIKRAQKTDRYYAGSAGLKSEPIMNDYLEVSGSISADYLDKTTFADRFAADSQFSLVLEWVGPLIASTFFETFRIKLPACFLDGETPTVDGPDVVNTEFPFKTQYDGTNGPVIVEYMSVDVAI